MVNIGSDIHPAATGRTLSPVETMLAKEAKNCLRPLGKSPRLFSDYPVHITGLQCVLSGNQVTQERQASLLHALRSVTMRKKP